VSSKKTYNRYNCSSTGIVQKVVRSVVLIPHEWRLLSQLIHKVKVCHLHNKDEEDDQYKQFAWNATELELECRPNHKCKKYSFIDWWWFFLHVLAIFFDLEKANDYQTTSSATGIEVRIMLLVATSLQQRHDHHQHIVYKLFVQCCLPTYAPASCINNFRTMLIVLLIPCSFFHCPLIITIFWTNTTCNKADDLKNGKNCGTTELAINFSQLIPPLMFISTSDLYHVVMLWSSSDFASATPGWLIVICCRALMNRSVWLVIAHSVKHILIECPVLTSTRRNILPLPLLKCR